LPGNTAFTDCTGLPRRASTIYQWVKKRFERMEEFQAAEGTVVYNYGAPRGQWADGGSFEGIRCIDRFLIKGGRILEQKVLAAAQRKGS